MSRQLHGRVQFQKTQALRSCLVLFFFSILLLWNASHNRVPEKKGKAFLNDFYWNINTMYIKTVLYIVVESNHDITTCQLVWLLLRETIVLVIHWFVWFLLVAAAQTRYMSLIGDQRNGDLKALHTNEVFKDDDWSECTKVSRPSILDLLIPTWSVPWGRNVATSFALHLRVALWDGMSWSTSGLAWHISVKSCGTEWNTFSFQAPSGHQPLLQSHEDW